jgi:2-amino-4-hydroxy-6-hydroxymethyldihydropteridine diphosphokinase
LLLILLNYNYRVMKKIFLGLGSNMGERAKNLEDSITRVEESVGKIITRSSVYRTQPWGFESENEFLNMVIYVDTDLTPSGLLNVILMIESQLGRVRSGQKYTSRIIDIDILLYDNEIVDDEVLVIPHPRMQDRRFVLVPLAEIAPDIIHPVIGKSIASLLKSCKDESRVITYR